MKSEKASRLFDPERFTLAQHPFYLFTYIFLQRSRELNRTLANYDIDYPRWRVLAALREWPDCTMQALSETTGSDRTTLTHTIRLMIDAGLVRKTSSATDRRSLVLALTAKGEKKLREILPEIVAVSERCFAGFTGGEIDQFVATLMRIISNMNDGDER